MFSSVHVQFTKCCPLPSPFMNTRVQFMFSSRKKYVNTKRFWTVIVLFTCFRTDLTRAARCSAAALQPRRTGHLVIQLIASSAIRSVMAAHVPCDPLDMPIDLTKICIVHPFHTPPMSSYMATRTSRLRLFASATRRRCLAGFFHRRRSSPSAGRTE